MTGAAVFLVDDDDAVRDSLHALLTASGFKVEPFSSALAFLAAYTPERKGCLIVDIRMPDMDGLTLQEELRSRQWHIPVIVITGHGDVPLAVRAMKAGALDFLEKPFDDAVLLDSVKRGLDAAARNEGTDSLAREAAEKLSALTQREREVLEHLVAGHSNKIIAHELGISPRTVEIHRAHLSEKMRARSLSEVIRLAIAANVSPSKGQKA